VVRGFRIMRIFRLIKSSVHIRLIMDTLINIMPQITNIMSLIFILFFIYASLGINLFSNIKLRGELNEKNNFQTFSNAMLLLMRCSTGEDWNVIMYNLSDQTECELEQTYEDMQRDGIQGCGNKISFPYFVSFVIIVVMLIMNLSVAAVIEGLDTARSENLGVVDADSIVELIELWRDFDPNATGWISVEDLIFVLC
jgi:uncharacterized membrane protein